MCVRAQPSMLACERDMKFIRAIIMVICIILIVIALLCLLSDLGGKGPQVVYAMCMAGKPLRF